MQADGFVGAVRKPSLPSNQSAQAPAPSTIPPAGGGRRRPSWARRPPTKPTTRTPWEQALQVHGKVVRMPGGHALHATANSRPLTAETYADIGGGNRASGPSSSLTCNAVPGGERQSSRAAQKHRTRTPRPPTAQRQLQARGRHAPSRQPRRLLDAAVRLRPWTKRFRHY